MNLAVMQPYLFPWIGYFQLIDCADRFLIYDDVQYIKGGWINRNRLLMNGQAVFFTLPVRGGSHASPINQRRFAETFERDKKRLLKTLQSAYASAPHFKSTLRVVQECLACEEDNVAQFLTRSLRILCETLNITTPLEVSSHANSAANFRGQDRLVQLCRELGATQYINAIGGRELYDPTPFAEQGVELRFLQTREIRYEQLKAPFTPNLSIIDVMMFNDRERIAALLKEYDLVTANRSGAGEGAQ